MSPKNPTILWRHFVPMYQVTHTLSSSPLHMSQSPLHMSQSYLQVMVKEPMCYRQDIGEFVRSGYGTFARHAEQCGSFRWRPNNR